MPPQKYIVKSGNAGSSSKPSPLPSKAPVDPPKPSDAPPPLFPPGVKTPLALLYERCQKNGWEKPFVDPKQDKTGTFDCFITARKRNIRDSGRMDRVGCIRILRRRLHKTAQDAKHWGATYG
ncbi:hypothetical protein CALCODRAFT_498692 [Calocera cornea HHB12733]|uniref:ATP-dependent RNA helicase DHX29 DSRM-like domain-containing protein n=1 Tax=Calocera cornea HHB12733 TaxID=1353952 RepID=A0A165EQV2_9BASI|nr:hypothetical protein CALCODRAFT_498692 [Calocera cornea HHB12733]